MPELPEVETMVRGVRPHLCGRKIARIVACPNKCRPISISPSLRQIQKRIESQRVNAVNRLGKRVVIELQNDQFLVFEPRMTGLVLLADPPDVEHLRIRIDLENASEYESVWFWDRRGLGTMTVYTKREFEAQFGRHRLGLDALQMTNEEWIRQCERSAREIKVLLLDQKVAAGIGNLYASEILHLAGIAPTTKANLLTSPQIERLAVSVQAVLIKAIELEGSTLGDGTYRNALNQNGSYQNEHRVYMKEGTRCVACQKSEIVRIVQAQRSTYFCPSCQPTKNSQSPLKTRKPS